MTRPTGRQGPLRDLALGARLAVAGGRAGWARLALVGAGVGLGVALLLLATAIPSVLDARADRVAAREVPRTLADGSDGVAPDETTVLTYPVRSHVQGAPAEGLLLQAEGDDPVLPPGVAVMPAPGELVVSPALERLLASDEGEAVRGRWGDRVVGEIGPAGLAGPGELRVYAGTDALTPETGVRTASFGTAVPDADAGPLLLLLGIVALVVLLLPVAIFVTTAVRFGGESRDRRLAALRLVGADVATTRRIAAGETLVGATLGLAVGALLAVVVGASMDAWVPAELGFYPGDVRPVPLLAALVVVLVPVASVVVTISAMRRVVAEPLGVVRRARGVRRRLWWRLVLPVGGGLLLLPLRDGADAVSSSPWTLMLGLVLLLVGVALLLPWLVDAVVRRLSPGGVAWQLAVRRLQLDSGTSVRAVSGIAVSVAGLVAMHGLVGAVETAYESGGGDAPGRVVEVYGQRTDDAWRTAVAAAPGVVDVHVLADVRLVADDGSDVELLAQVGDCAALALEADIDDCAAGDAFVAAAPDVTAPWAGMTFRVSTEDGPGPQWTVPADARTVPADARYAGSGVASWLLLTPQAADGLVLADAGEEVRVVVDPAVPDAMDHLRTAVLRVDPTAYVTPGAERVATTMDTVRAALLVGTIGLLVVVGASLLVDVLEQLRERRRLLAVLLAFGTRRRTLGVSVLYQVAVPVALGLALAVATGAGLAAVLQRAAGAGVRLDWFGIGTTSGTAAAVVLLTTAATLPLLWRLTRPGALRSE